MKVYNDGVYCLFKVILFKVRELNKFTIVYESEFECNLIEFFNKTLSMISTNENNSIVFSCECDNIHFDYDRELIYCYSYI